MRPVSYLVIGCALICATNSSPAQVVWNPTSAFSTTNGNPNGVWTYGWMDTAFTTFAPYASTSANGWLGNLGGDGSPVIWLNTGGSTSYGNPPGDLALHPGPGFQPSILRWTAPAGSSGTAQIVGRFLAGDGGVMAVAIRFNGSSVWSATDAGSFDFNQLFTAGDQLDFAVYGGYNFGTTPLELTITGPAIPEPAASAGLLGFAALGLVAFRRRRSLAVVAA